MGKEIKVVCDSCGNEHLMGGTYYTLTVRKIEHGKQNRNPAIYLCPDCFKKTKLKILLACMDESEELL